MQTGLALRGKRPDRFRHPFLLIIVLLALASALGLDYLNWEKGRRSYLLWPFLGENPAQESGEQLLNTVYQTLARAGVSTASASQYQDDQGFYHLLVEIPLEHYTLLEAYLEAELLKNFTTVAKQQARRSEKKSLYLWEIQGENKERLFILFSCPEEIQGKEAPALQKTKSKVAIIVDDMGYSLEAIQAICALKQPVTVAILPHTPLAEETSFLAHQNGLEVMLHLPMESINSGDFRNGIKGIILSRMGREEMFEILEDNLSRVPYAVGVNNHMGSKITPDENLMPVILGFLKERGLYFVDSKTTRDSVAYQLALKIGLPSACRHVFLDTENDENHIKSKLIELFRLASEKGKAVGICHPLNKTLEVLKENLRLAEDYGVQPVFVSQVLD